MTFQPPLAALVIGALLALPAAAHDPTAAAGRHAAATGLQAYDFPEAAEVELIDQHGAPRRFYRDLIAGRLVAMNFIYTSCTTICPPLGAIFAALESELTERGVGDAALLSISIDPVTDTPERLAAWAARFGGGDRWTLLTGDKPEVDHLLKRLGLFAAVKEDHAPIILLGNAASDQWTLAYGLTPPERLADALLALRGR